MFMEMQLPYPRDVGLLGRGIHVHLINILHVRYLVRPDLSTYSLRYCEVSAFFETHITKCKT